MRELVVFALAGVGAYLARGSFILLVGNRHLPEAAERLLRNVGPAVFAALITSLLLTDGAAAFVRAPAEVLAVVAAVAVAYKTRNFVWTFIVGMAMFWTVGALVSGA